MHGGPTGFTGAYISKAMMLLTLGFSLGAQLSHKVGLFSLDLGALGRGQLWRLLTHQFVFASSSELVLGLILLYTWRLFERQFGGRKFGACVLFLHVLSTSVQLVVLAISSRAGGRFSFASGPYTLLFGLLAMFFFDIPQSAPFRVAGLPLSDKSFLYLLAAQMAAAAIPASLYTALIGLVLGALYRWEALPFHRLRIPQSLASCCSAACMPVLSGSALRTFAGLQTRNGAAVGGQPRFLGGGRALGGGAGHPGAAVGAAAAPDDAVGGAVGAGGYARVADDADLDLQPQGEILAEGGGGGVPRALVAVDPRALEQLLSMGFTEARARAALVNTRNNIPAATALLIGS